MTTNHDDRSTKYTIYKLKRGFKDLYLFEFPYLLQ